jgi:NACalpha-BTF3-like transcription factor
MTTFIIIIIVLILIVIIFRNIKARKKSVKLSQDRSQNSPRNFKTQEEFHQALTTMFANAGITVIPTMGLPEHMSNCKKDTYQIQFFPKREKTAAQVEEETIQLLMSQRQISREQAQAILYNPM